jgi:uncharacterized membrane protein
VAMVLNSTPWGITLFSLALSLITFTLISIAVAHYRRQRVPSPERPIYTFFDKRDEAFFARSFGSQSRLKKKIKYCAREFNRCCSGRARRLRHK